MSKFSSVLVVEDPATSIYEIVAELERRTSMLQEEVRATFNEFELIAAPGTTKQLLLNQYGAELQRRELLQQQPDLSLKQELIERFKTQTPEEVADYLKQQVRGAKPRGGRGNGPAMLYKGVSFPGD